MKNLQAYIDQRNAWASIFGTAPVEFPLSQKQVNDLAEQLDSDLSPENLTCDGELSAAKVRQRARLFNGAFAELTKYATANNMTLPQTYCA